jgi:hypothetical protein
LKLADHTENSVQSENAEFTTIRETVVISMNNSLFVALLALIASSFRTRAALQAEILALRHQLAVLQANAPRHLRLQRSDRVLWVLLSRFWSGWRPCLQIVQPATVIAWHRRAFAWYWTRESRRQSGRPEVSAEIRDLIQRMSRANPLWGAPRIHGELLKLGIAVAQSTVAKYLQQHRKPPSQNWRTFLTNHVEQTASIDFFTVPTATFRVLFVFVVLSHARRRVVHFGVTEHPTEEWTAQQIREAFPWDQTARYLLRDRDAIYGSEFAAIWANPRRGVVSHDGAGRQYLPVCDGLVGRRHSGGRAAEDREQGTNGSDREACCIHGGSRRDSHSRREGIVEQWDSCD